MKQNIVLRIAALLLCLVLGSTYLLSGMLAKYTVEGASRDSARVAKFGTLVLKETKGTSVTDGRQFSILPGAAIEKDPAVMLGNSEVAVRIYVTIEADGWTQNGTEFTYGTDFLSFSLAEGWVRDGETNTFYLDVPANSEDMTYNILKDNAIQVSPAMEYDDYYDFKADALNIKISARAVQID